MVPAAAPTIVELALLVNPPTVIALVVVLPAVVTCASVGVAPPPDALMVTTPVPEAGDMVTFVPAIIWVTVVAFTRLSM